MTTILGLDISSSSTGWAVLVDGYLINKTDCGSIKMKQDTHGERLCFLEPKLTDLITSYKPDLIIVEDMFLSFKNPRTVITLAHYHGLVRQVVWKTRGEDMAHYTVSDIRKILGSAFNVNLLPGKREKLESGLDGKHLTFDLMKKIFKLDDFEFKKHNDATDALAVALARHLIGTGRELPPEKPKTKSKKSKG